MLAKLSIIWIINASLNKVKLIKFFIWRPVIWQIRPSHARIVILNLFSMKASSLSIRKKGLKTILRDARNAEGLKKAKETISEAEELIEADGDK
jgi:hypothetical protein